MRFRDVHERPQTATKKGATLGASNVAPHPSRSNCSQCPESSRIPPFAARSPGKSLQADGWRRPLSESCPDEAVEPIAIPLPQSFDPLPLPQQIFPTDTGQHTIFGLGDCPCDSFPPLSLGYPKRATGNKPARTRQKAAAVCIQICPSPKKGRSFSSPAIRPHQNREPW